MSQTTIIQPPETGVAPPEEARRFPGTKPRMLLIVNPWATSVSARLKNLVVYALRGRYDIEAVETQSRNHATALTREAVGEDFIIVYRLSMLDLVPGGSSFDEVITLAKAVEAAGATALGGVDRLRRSGRRNSGSTTPPILMTDRKATTSSGVIGMNSPTASPTPRPSVRRPAAQAFTSAWSPAYVRVRPSPDSLS